MGRRQLIQLLLALGVVPRAWGAAKAVPRPDFVFIPGTWLGGWTWGPVRDRLWAMGYRAFTPTMSGVAERAASSHPGIDLYTHIHEVVDLIEFEDMRRVILVGHSFAGLTITGVADAMRERMQHLVYFDGLVPRPGVMKAWPDEDPMGRYPDDYQRRFEKLVDGYRMDFFADYKLDMLVSKEYPELRERLRERIRPHPWKQWSTKLVLQNGGYEGLAKTYVSCAGQEYQPSTDWMPGPAKNNPEWNWIDLPVSRMGMMTHPELVTDTLISLVRKP